MISFSCSLRHEVQGQAGVRRSILEMPDLQAAARRSGTRQDPGVRAEGPDRRHRQQPGQGRRRWRRHPGASDAARPGQKSVQELLARQDQERPALPHRGRDRPRRHGRRPAGRRLRHPPRSRRQVPARPGRRRQEGPLRRGSPDHRPTRTSEHRADPRTRRRCQESGCSSR